MPKQSTIRRVARAAAGFGDAADVLRQAAATRLGLNRTDYRIVTSMRAGESRSAGELAAAVGLSPAATTEAVQRLVARGVLERDTDPADRRRAVITLAPQTAHLLEALVEPLRRDGEELMQGYSEAELELLLDFLEAGRRLQLAQAERVRRGSGDVRSARDA